MKSFSYVYNHHSLLRRFVWIQHNDQLLVDLVGRALRRYHRGYEYFSGLIPTTSSVVFITARTASIFVSSTAVIIYIYYNCYYVITLEVHKECYTFKWWFLSIISFHTRSSHVPGIPFSPFSPCDPFCPTDPFSPSMKK